jgi:addiction module RelB/DinJ family antitoxin
MNNAVITLKTNSVLKSKAMKIADDLGFSLSSLINAYLKNLVRNRSITFNLNDESYPTKFMIEGLKESAADIKAGRISPAFSDTKKAAEWLRSDKKTK